MSEEWQGTGGSGPGKPSHRESGPNSDADCAALPDAHQAGTAGGSRIEQQVSASAQYWCAPSRKLVSCVHVSKKRFLDEVTDRTLVGLNWRTLHLLLPPFSEAQLYFRLYFVPFCLTRDLYVTEVLQYVKSGTGFVRVQFSFLVVVCIQFSTELRQLQWNTMVNWCKTSTLEGTLNSSAVFCLDWVVTTVRDVSSANGKTIFFCLCVVHGNLCHTL